MVPPAILPTIGAYACRRGRLRDPPCAWSRAPLLDCGAPQFGLSEQIQTAGRGPKTSKRFWALPGVRYVPNSQRRGPKDPTTAGLLSTNSQGRGPEHPKRPTGPILVLELQLLTLPRGLL